MELQSVVKLIRNVNGVLSNGIGWDSGLVYLT